MTISTAINKLMVNSKWLVVFSLFTIYCALFTIPTPVFAQSSPAACESSQTEDFSFSAVVDDFNKCAIKNNIYDDKIFNANQVTFGIPDSLSILVTGFSVIHPETDKITARSSALAGVSSGLAMMYSQPPASGVSYLAEKINHLNPVQPAYAQETGIGFTALQPVVGVWTAFRNISYVGFTIVFVITGFMIMFRRKISSQAVATIQDSLPRLVIALILVTFSYAIVGLMIDLMYVVINLTIAILAQAHLLDPKIAQFVFTENLFGIITKGWGSFADATSKVVSATLNQLFHNVFGVGGCNPNLSVNEAFGVKGCIAESVIWLIGLAAKLIFGIALLFVMVRLFFTLLITYVTIILLTVFAPFIFLIQSLPGQNGAKGWFKQVIANIAVFPTVIAMILLAGIIAGVPEYGSVSGKSQFQTQGAGYFNPPLLGGFAANNIGNLVGLGILLMMPSAAKMIKETLSVKDGGALGIGMGAAMGAAAAGAQPVTKTGGAMISPYKQAYSYGRFTKAQETLGQKSGGVSPHLPGVPGPQNH